MKLTISELFREHFVLILAFLVLKRGGRDTRLATGPLSFPGFHSTTSIYKSILWAGSQQVQGNSSLQSTGKLQVGFLRTDLVMEAMRKQQPRPDIRAGRGLSRWRACIDQQAPGICCLCPPPPSTLNTSLYHHAQVFHVVLCGGSDSGPHVYNASTLLTEPSPTYFSPLTSCAFYKK